MNSLIIVLIIPPYSTLFLLVDTPFISIHWSEDPITSHCSHSSIILGRAQQEHRRSLVPPDQEDSKPHHATMFAIPPLIGCSEGPTSLEPQNQ